MRARINHDIEAGRFVKSMNRQVISQKIDFVYAHDDRRRDFIEKH
jgi:hypothetical protein